MTVYTLITNSLVSCVRRILLSNLEIGYLLKFRQTNVNKQRKTIKLTDENSPHVGLNSREKESGICCYVSGREQSLF